MQWILNYKNELLFSMKSKNQPSDGDHLTNEYGLYGVFDLFSALVFFDGFDGMAFTTKCHEIGFVVGSPEL